MKKKIFNRKNNILSNSTKHAQLCATAAAKSHAMKALFTRELPCPSSFYGLGRKSKPPPASD